MIKISPKREALDVMASLANSLQHLKNSRALLVGMSNGAITVENHVVISQNIKYRITIRSSNSTSGIYPKESKAGSRRNICTPIFKEGLFIITKRWKQPKCQPKAEWIHNTWSIQQLPCWSSGQDSELPLWRAQVPYPVGELRSHKVHSETIKKIFNGVYPHSGMLFSLKRKGHFDTCRNVDAL